MALYPELPFTNFTDLNLDWIIEKLKDLEERVEALEEAVGIEAEVE